MRFPNTNIKKEYIQQCTTLTYEDLMTNDSLTPLTRPSNYLRLKSMVNLEEQLNRADMTFLYAYDNCYQAAAICEKLSGSMTFCVGETLLLNKLLATNEFKNPCTYRIRAEKLITEIIRHYNIIVRARPGYITSFYDHGAECGKWSMKILSIHERLELKPIRKIRAELLILISESRRQTIGGLFFGSGKHCTHHSLQINCLLSSFYFVA